MNPNQILFATDFSDRDLEAFNSSCKLALQWNATLQIVHVQDPRETALAPDLQTNVNRELARFTPDDFGVKYVQTVLTGDAADEILRFADEKAATLIVLGTHGREGVQRFFSGSVAEKIMRNANCPVMTRRAGQGEVANRKVERILVPVDFSVYGYAAVDFASRMALATSAELTICYVDEAGDNQEELWHQLRSFKPTNSKIRHIHKLFQGIPGKEICEYANAKPYDAVVIGTHGRTGLSRAIMGSVAEYVVRHAECPVVSVKPSNKRARLIG